MRDKRDILAFIGSLKVGDPVRVTVDGRTYEWTVQRGPRRSDGAYGSWESTQVTVGRGPGYYNREVSVDAIAAGYVDMTRA